MLQTRPTADVLYPDSDGKPMSDNTKQYRWIVRLVSNLRQHLQGQTAFVAGDLLWYPVQVEQPPAPSQAPDVMVVLGRPSFDRGSYKQWQEENIAPQLVFEIISPSNSATEISQKQGFYDRYGVLEMYFYDPDSFEFWALVRQRAEERPTLITGLNLPWTSPLLGIRFEQFEDGLAVFHPNGEPFKDPDELFQERDQARQELDLARQERDLARQTLERAQAKLRELGINPDELE